MKYSESKILMEYNESKILMEYSESKIVLGRKPRRSVLGARHPRGTSLEFGRIHCNALHMHRVTLESNYN